MLSGALAGAPQVRARGLGSVVGTQGLRESVRGGWVRLYAISRPY